MERANPEAILLEALGSFGADTASHSSRTLLEHLAGTHRLLAEWGNDRDTCIAGLFHSIYGTVYFGKTTVSPTERPRISSLIGEPAERLAYLFCAIDRQKLFEQSESQPPYAVSDRFENRPIAVSQADFRLLFEIEIANFVEQVPSVDRLKPEKLAWYVAYYGRCKGNVSAAAYGAYSRFFGLPVA